MLVYGGSAWTATETGLQRRVGPVAQEAYDQEAYDTASLPHDAAGDELVEAWRKVYDREPDPSDAWDHSIKAVEHIFKPVVCPDSAKATLSNVIGDLRSQPGRWKLVLPVRTVTSVLTGLW